VPLSLCDDDGGLFRVILLLLLGWLALSRRQSTLPAAIPLSSSLALPPVAFCQAANYDYSAELHTRSPAGPLTPDYSTPSCYLIPGKTEESHSGTTESKFMSRAKVKQMLEFTWKPKYNRYFRFQIIFKINVVRFNP